jgi:hypothetical protein
LLVNRDWRQAKVTLPHNRIANAGSAQGDLMPRGIIGQDDLIVRRALRRCITGEGNKVPGTSPAGVS